MQSLITKNELASLLNGRRIHVESFASKTTVRVNYHLTTDLDYSTMLINKSSGAPIVRETLKVSQLMDVPIYLNLTSK